MNTVRAGTRNQLEWGPRSLDEVRSHHGGSGTWATDPKLKLALWVYATSEGVSSARELADLVCTTTPTAGSVAVFPSSIAACRSSA
jgi:hypothetical protein